MISLFLGEQGFLSALLDMFLSWSPEHLEINLLLCCCCFLRLFFYFWMWTILKVFIYFVIILLLFYVSVFWPRDLWDLSSPTRE